MQKQKSFENNQPTLYLVATPIGNLQEMTPRAVSILKEVDVIAAEDTRMTLKLLSYFEIKNKLIAHHLHNERDSSSGIVQLLASGKNVAIVSDAGYPLVSDPGQLLVNKVLAEGFNVVPISGSNAMLNALVASGITTQPFVFYGFLGHSEKERLNLLNRIKHYPETLIFYEAPHRLGKMLKSVLNTLGDRPMCIARELTKKHEEFIRGSVSECLEIADELKGEMVLVIDGFKGEVESIETLIPLKEQIDLYIIEGLSANEAIKKVAKERNLARNEVYKLFHN